MIFHFEFENLELKAIFDGTTQTSFLAYVFRIKLTPFLCSTRKSGKPIEFYGVYRIGSSTPHGISQNGHR